MAEKLPSGNFRVRVYLGKDESGKRLYESFIDDDEDVAELKAQQFKVDRKRKTKVARLTIGEAIDKYIESKMERKTYMQGIMEIRLEDITQEILQQEINREAKVRAPN